MELVSLIENWTGTEIDRLHIAFDIKQSKSFEDRNPSKAQKANLILAKLKEISLSGPFTESFQIDVLQYLVDKYFRSYQPTQQSTSFSWDSEFVEPEPINEEERFASAYPQLFNSLKRDGYTIRNMTVTKLLPNEIEEAKTENELMRLVDKFNFNVSKGHLEQAIDNHSHGNWAGANAQFRTFTESLLIEISNKLVPSRNCTSAGDALQWLSTQSVLSPVFLSEHLNEVRHAGCNYPFVNGLWKRLHPHGSHPGLSDEEDSTFRYHITIVFARYLLDRLETRR